MLTLDLSEFERKARDLSAAIDQVPFALAGALNDALFKARDHLINQTWPNSISVRNPSFIRAALNVEKATKGNLSGTIFDRFGRAHLKLHATGGIKKARGRLAIPADRVKAARGAKGVPARLRPGNLKGAIRKGNSIYQVQGTYKKAKPATKTRKAVKAVDNRKLVFMYALRQTARVKQDVPFYEDFRSIVAQEARASFPQRLARAMQTRR